MEKSQLENYHVHYGPAQGWSQVDLHELWRLMRSSAARSHMLRCPVVRASRR